MATSTTFSTMLNQYLPNDLLREEMVKRDWLLNNVDTDNSWLGGTLVVPFQGANASSVAFGSLTDTTDVSEDAYVRGTISTQPEVWGTMKFNHTDLMQHGKVSEQNFLRILPDTVDNFTDFMKQCVSLNMLNGSAFAFVTDATNAATGLLIVDHPERFVIGQKCYLDDDDSAAVAVYITAINMNSATVTVSAARAGTAYNASSYSVAQNACFHFDGSQTNGLTSLKSSLLASANTSGGVTGGSTLYGQTKTAYPYLQAININGASNGANVTSSNILDALFDSFTTIRNRGKGNPNKVLMSYKHLGSIMKLLETNKGAYHIDQKSTSVNIYGWVEIEITGVKGTLSVVGIQEANDDAIMFLDMRALKFYTNGYFRKRVSPDGIEYFESRATTGYSYFVDICLFGDLVLLRPSYCGILYGISY